jgi:hypothetical protein
MIIKKNQLYYNQYLKCVFVYLGIDDTESKYNLKFKQIYPLEEYDVHYNCCDEYVQKNLKEITELEYKLIKL